MNLWIASRGHPAPRQAQGRKPQDDSVAGVFSQPTRRSAARADESGAAILMLTAKGQEQDIVLGLNVGADDYVTKPFRIRELIARVNAFLRRRSAPSSLCRFGECEVDLAARVVRRGGRMLSLTAKEFKLLEFFIARTGRALSRDIILDAVWGRSVFVTPRSIDRCVTTLRAKIEPDPHCPIYIHTLRDVGYRSSRPRASDVARRAFSTFDGQPPELRVISAWAETATSSCGWTCSTRQTPLKRRVSNVGNCFRGPDYPAAGRRAPTFAARHFSAASAASEYPGCPVGRTRQRASKVARH